MANAKKTCLLIDNDKIDDVIERIKRRASREQIDLDIQQFNVGNEEEEELFSKDGDIDIQKVKEVFLERYGKKAFDIYAFDFQLDDENVNGVELIRQLVQDKHNSVKIIYSGLIKDVVEKNLISTILDCHIQLANPKLSEERRKELSKKKKRAVNQIKVLVSKDVKEFVDREDIGDTIIKILRKQKINYPLIIESRLLEYQEFTFSNTYPPFEGLLLGAILERIKKNANQEGSQFISEIVDRAISHMIDLNTPIEE